MKRRTLAVAALATMLLLTGCNDATTTNMSTTGDSDLSWEESYDSTSYRDGADDYDVQSTDAEMPDSGMVRREGHIELSSRDFDAATKALSEIVERYAVVITTDNTQSYQRSKGNEYHERSVTVRVKREEFDSLFEAVESSESWRVKQSNKSSDDITASYNDDRQRIEALQIRYDWYKQQAETTEDPELVIEYTNQMLDLLDQIRSLENTQTRDRQDVAYSIVSITLSEDTALADRDSSTGVWEEISDQFAVLPQNIWGAFGYLMLLIISLLPPALVIGLAVLVIHAIRKQWQKAHPDAVRKGSGTNPRPEEPADMIPTENYDIPQATDLSDID